MVNSEGDGCSGREASSVGTVVAGAEIIALGFIHSLSMVRGQ